MEFFALFNAVHSIELMSWGYAIEYTEWHIHTPWDKMESLVL